MTHEVLVLSAVEQLVIEQPDTEQLTEVRTQQELIEIAVPGPRGPQGIPGQPGGASFSDVAAETVGGHRAVRQTSSGLMYASIGDVSHAGRVVGITVGAAAVGGSVTYQAAGKITEPSWNWVGGGDIWLGLDGVLTQSLVPGAAFMQRLGYAIDSTSMWVEVSEPIVFE